MTPAEKAEELYNKMLRCEDPMGNYPMCFETAKQCALIAVDEILYELDHIPASNETREYWEEVKQEIEKI